MSEERNMMTECWTCKHKQSIPGDCHIQCAKPDKGVLTMRTKPPSISQVIEQACRDVAPKYDVDIARGRAFNKALWTIIAGMPKEQAIRYIANCLKRYGNRNA